MIALNGFRRRVCRLRAFTLVELLTVIALIAMLAALLLPAFSRAEARTREATCATNLRSWGQAFYLYAHDCQGYLPHPDDQGGIPRRSRSIPGTRSTNAAMWMFCPP
ncbi:MAG: prepilin-type N-terminal cleavage/methylation domain-containing protein [Verrucomicrobiota bacterium]|nr:prepilin-type N-terminal cleavage/methylation domain-containing protein [Verrucomicrobiota bacterium]